MNSTIHGFLAAKKNQTHPQADTSAEERKIDLLVYHLYGLSFDEAKIIPIQLKGHYQTPPYNDSISYNAEVSDLNNYLQNSGALFFVYIDENDNYP